MSKTHYINPLEILKIPLDFFFSLSERLKISIMLCRVLVLNHGLKNEVFYVMTSSKSSGLLLLMTGI